VADPCDSVLELNQAWTRSILSNGKFGGLKIDTTANLNNIEMLNIEGVVPFNDRIQVSATLLILIDKLIMPID